MPVYKVALDDSLTNVKQALEEQGYEVVDLNSGDLDSVLAVVINGLDDNLMGIETRQTEAPIIDADGLTAEEVLEEVREAATLRA